jgi:two-component system chemotaxis response regulator CheB
MWLMKNPPNGRYRCQVGHAFSEQTLEASQATAAEQALWNAVIYLEEHARVLERLARNERERGRSPLADRFDRRVEQVRRHVDDVRAVILSMGKGPAVDDEDGGEPEAS